MGSVERGGGVSVTSGDNIQSSSGARKEKEDIEPTASSAVLGKESGVARSHSNRGFTIHFL